MEMKVSMNIDLHKNIKKCKKMHIFAYLFSAGGVVFFVQA